MRRFVLFLLLCPLAAPAGEFVDRASGLRIRVPDGWERDTNREKGTVKFFGIHSLGGNKYVTLAVEAGSAYGFSADEWLDNEKKVKARHIAEVEQPFKPDRNRLIGGLDAVGYVFGGKGKLKGHEMRVRFRVYGVVHGETFFQITEFSSDNAHAEAADELKEIWDGISFQEGDEDEDDEQGGDDDPRGLQPAEGQPTEAEDKLGNYKTKLPPGWEIEREAPTDAQVQRRMIFVRKDGNGNVIAGVEVWKILWGNAATFHTGTPNDVLQSLNKDSKFFESFYGERSSGAVVPEMDEGVGLGAAEKAGQYEIRAITMEEQANVIAAEKRVRKGEKGVEVPKYRPLVLRGRLAMISPNIYLTRANFARSLADDPQLLAEYNKIHEDWEFLTSEATPPPLNVGGKIGDTTADPANAEDRKKQKAVHDKRGRKTYRIEYTFTIPAGWVRLAKKRGPDSAFFLYAQDKRNNWITVSIANVNHKKGSEERKNYPKKTQIETWKSNWTGKARGTKIPSKPDKFSLGKARGEGYKSLRGTVDGFRGTFTAILSDKFPGKGWRTFVEIETRGDGDKVFADGLKLFLKSLKAKDVKVK